VAQAGLPRTPHQHAKTKAPDLRNDRGLPVTVLPAELGDGGKRGPASLPLIWGGAEAFANLASCLVPRQPRHEPYRERGGKVLGLPSLFFASSRSPVTPGQARQRSQLGVRAAANTVPGTRQRWIEIGSGTPPEMYRVQRGRKPGA